jgi:hypothetical protein
MERQVPQLPELMTSFWVTEHYPDGLSAEGNSAPTMNANLIGGLLLAPGYGSAVMCA